MPHLPAYPTCLYRAYLSTYTTPRTLYLPSHFLPGSAHLHAFAACLRCFASYLLFILPSDVVHVGCAILIWAHYPVFTNRCSFYLRYGAPYHTTTCTWAATRTTPARRAAAHLTYRTTPPLSCNTFAAACYFFAPATAASFTYLHYAFARTAARVTRTLPSLPLRTGWVRLDVLRRLSAHERAAHSACLLSRRACAPHRHSTALPARCFILS